MLAIQPCNTYRALVRGRALHRGPGAQSAFKVYFIDIVGRENRSLTEWLHCGKTPDALMSRLGGVPGAEGIGFITAFPHITKIFRFGPENETVINVRAWNTPNLTDRGLACSDGYVQFACLAEAMVAADEYRFWAEADTVEEYLQQWSEYAEGSIKSHDKLRGYWASG